MLFSVLEDLLITDSISLIQAGLFRYLFSLVSDLVDRAFQKNGSFHMVYHILGIRLFIRFLYYRFNVYGIINYGPRLFLIVVISVFSLVLVRMARFLSISLMFSKNCISLLLFSSIHILLLLISALIFIILFLLLRIYFGVLSLVSYGNSSDH